MKQTQFEDRNKELWLQLETQLQIVTGPQLKEKTHTSIKLEQDFPAHYRQICHHLALARSRGYSQALVNRLEQLVLTAHQQLYRNHSHFLSSLIRYLVRDFPWRVRKEFRFVVLAAVLFFGPLIAMLVTIQYAPDMVYTVLSGPTLEKMENMYQPSSEKLGRDRASDSDFYMFGYYIFNNTSIGFRTFAGGLLFGLGSLFYLLYNGLHIGAVAGHLTHLGYKEIFWPFVAGHSAMELMAIVLSGAGGLKLGAALLKPGQRTRLRAVRETAIECVHLIYGVILMFFIAAFIEAFWSSNGSIEAQIKYAVGVVLWILVFAYFLFVGRNRHAD